DRGQPLRRSERRLSPMTRVYWIMAVVLIVLAWVIAAALYPGLPAKIPSHWNIQGKIDAYGPKSTIFLVPGVMIFFLGLFWLLPVLSPKNFEFHPFPSPYPFLLF